MNGKETVFDGGSYYFWEIELNVTESNYRAFNLIQPERLFFSWYYLKALPHRDHLILLSVVLQTFYCAFCVCRKKAFFPAVCKNQTIILSGNDVPSFCKVTYFAWSLVWEAKLLPTFLPTKYHIVKPCIWKQLWSTFLLEKNFTANLLATLESYLL